MEVDALSIGVRLLLYVELTMLFGVPVFVIGVLRGPAGIAVLAGWRPMLRLLAWAALATTVFGLCAMAVQMAGAVEAAWNRKALLAVIATPYGQAWLVRTTSLSCIAILLLRRRGWAWEQTLALMLAGIALGSLAWGGHALTLQGTARSIHLSSDVIHLLAAGGWVGALAVLCVMIAGAAKSGSADETRMAARALAGFSSAGTVIVATLVISGTVNGWMIVGIDNVSSVMATPYGQLMIAKIVLFAIMLGLAAVNRFRLTPELELALAHGQHDRALRHLRKSVVLELGLALSILGLVAVLGLLAPLPEQISQDLSG